MVWFPRGIDSSPRDAMLVLPVGVETDADDVGVDGAEGTGRDGCFRMDPVEHDAGAIGPIPVETDREVVVFAAVHVVEIQIRITGLELPRTRAEATLRPEEVRTRHIAAELGAVLAVAFINT